MIDTLQTAIERLLRHENISSTPLDVIFRELIEPTLHALEAYHDEGAAIRTNAMMMLDANFVDEAKTPGERLQEASEFLQAKASEFESVRVCYEEFHANGEALGYFEGAHEAFFVAAMQYLHLIQLDALAYTVSRELSQEHSGVVDLEQTMAHVHAEIENSYYLLDHGLQDVRETIADVLLQPDAT